MKKILTVLTVASLFANTVLAAENEQPITWPDLLSGQTAEQATPAQAKKLLVEVHQRLSKKGGNKKAELDKILQEADQKLSAIRQQLDTKDSLFNADQLSVDKYLQYLKPAQEDLKLSSEALKVASTALGEVSKILEKVPPKTKKSKKFKDVSGYLAKKQEEFNGLVKKTDELKQRIDQSISLAEKLAEKKSAQKEEAAEEAEPSDDRPALPSGTLKMSGYGRLLSQSAPTVPTAQVRVSRARRQNDVSAAIGGLIGNFPLHLELGISLLSGALQQGSTHNEYMIRAPAYLEPKFELTLGVEFSQLVFAAYLDLGAAINGRIKDMDELTGIGVAPGLTFNTGLKALYRIDRNGRLAAGVFGGYYQHQVNVRDHEFNDLLGQGFLIGGIFRFRPVDLIAFNAKLAAGPEWMHTKDPDGNLKRNAGAVVMFSLGIALSYSNVPRADQLPNVVAQAPVAPSAPQAQIGVSVTVSHQEKAKEDKPEEPKEQKEKEPAAASKTVQHQEKTVEEESAAKQDSPSNTKQAESAPQPAPSKEKDAPQSFQDFQREMLAAVNAERAKAGLQPLRWNQKLAAAAALWARNLSQQPNLMGQAGTAKCQDSRAYGCGHRSATGKYVEDRVAVQKYQFQYLAENAALGQQSVAEVMAAWMKSPTHRKNLLTARITEIGAAHVGNAWVQVFGQPQGEPVPNS